MTQKSYLYDGLSLGDATLAPYEAATFNALSVLANESGRDFVSSFWNKLGTACQVTADGVNHRITLKSGLAAVDNVVYFNSGDMNITLADAHATLPRWDRIVLRADYQSSTGKYTVRAKVIQGSSAAQPEIPEIHQTSGYVYELPLASVYVLPATVPIYSYNILDEREMLDVGYYLSPKPYPSNITINGEWIGGVGIGAGGAPAMWGTTLAAATDITFEVEPLLSGFARGNNIKITFNDADNLFHNGNGQKLARNSNRWVTIWFDYKVGGSAINFYVDGGTTQVAVLRPLDDYRRCVLRYKFTDADQDCKLAFKATGDDSILHLSPMQISYGTQIVPPYVPRSEFIPYWEPRIHQDYSVNVQQDNINLDELATITDLRGVMLTVGQKNALSSVAANTQSLVYIVDNTTDNIEYFRIQTAGIANNASRWQQGFIRPDYSSLYVDGPESTYSIYYNSAIYGTQYIYVQEVGVLT